MAVLWERYATAVDHLDSLIWYRRIQGKNVSKLEGLRENLIQNMGKLNQLGQM